MSRRFESPTMLMHPELLSHVCLNGFPHAPATQPGCVRYGRTCARHAVCMAVRLTRSAATSLSLRPPHLPAGTVATS